MASERGQVRGVKTCRIDRATGTVSFDGQSIGPGSTEADASKIAVLDGSSITYMGGGAFGLEIYLKDGRVAGCGITVQAEIVGLDPGNSEAAGWELAETNARESKAHERHKIFVREQLGWGTLPKRFRWGVVEVHRGHWSHRAGPWGATATEGSPSKILVNYHTTPTSQQKCIIL